MIIEKVVLSKSDIDDECVVVIDVLRAFTTAAFAFASGANRIIPVSAVDDAFSLRNRYKDWLLVGEVDGIHIPGFDFGNSPSEVAAANLQNRTIVQRTSAGTQGIVRSLNSHRILVASFAVASATLRRIFEINPSKVTFCITGGDSGDEDLALAEYLESKIRGVPISSEPFIQRIHNSSTAKFLNSTGNHQDVELATSLDIFNFSMEVSKKGELPMILKNIPKQLENLGIWQGGSSEF